MSMPSITELLTAWREAERRWEHLPPDEDVRAARMAVVAAWAEYQDAAIPADSDEFLLVADDEGTYVGATRGVARVLGYESAEIVGLRIQDVAVPALRAGTPREWSAFLAAGRQDGTFGLTAKDGHPVSLRYQARAHHPVPGFHVSRLWPERER
jgi:PAS domain-containing protein